MADSAPGAAWQHVQAQPSWISRAAITVFALVLLLPFLALLILGLLLATIVVAVLVIARRIALFFRGLLPRRDGRRNVRVITRPPDAR